MDASAWWSDYRIGKGRKDSKDSKDSRAERPPKGLQQPYFYDMCQEVKATTNGSKPPPTFKATTKLQSHHQRSKPPSRGQVR
jgi:hypothetical protein